MNKSFFLWVAVIFLSFTLYTQNVLFQDAVQKVQRIERAYDSLRTEHFPLEVQLGRYETTLEIMEKESPGLAEEFRRIMSERTE